MATTDLQHPPGPTRGSSSRARRTQHGRRLIAAPVDQSVAPVRYPWTRRILDVILASFLLLLSSPILVVVAAVVRCSGRPVLFRHTRVGTGGVTFPMYKFRTMVPEAEALLAADPDLHRRHRANGFKLPADQDQDRKSVV